MRQWSSLRAVGVVVVLFLTGAWGANLSGQSQSTIPQNAHPNSYGSGWECNRGYRVSGTGCVPVILPANAKLDYYGHDWECSRGYRVSGNQCVPVSLPANAKLDYY